MSSIKELNLPIHANIVSKLQYFQDIHKIPNIIFHGPSGSGKKTLVHNFIYSIYGGDTEKIKSFVMYVNCAHGKGIKFIRDELKFFAKTHIHSNGGHVFKSIVLLNADKLTIDAQSALRRCIELFTHTTRFFILIEDKYKLLKPILSRFCEIYVSEPIFQGKPLNLHQYNLNNTFQLKEVKTKRLENLKSDLQKYMTDKKKYETSYEKLFAYSSKLYEKGYSGLDIITLLENHNNFVELSFEKRYELLFAFNRVKGEFRNEKLLMLFILEFLFLSLEHTLENISFM